MAIFSDYYYIIMEGNAEYFDCLLSYKNIEKAKRHSKKIAEQLNTTCLVVKPIVKVIPCTQFIIEDLKEENNG